MKIKKMGHSCLVVDIGGKKILTDPGTYSERQGMETDICAVLISHTHPDHFDLESLKKVLTNNPEAIVVTNDSVGTMLKEEGIPYKLVEDGQTEMINGLLIEGYGTVHAHVYETIPPLANTSYFVDNTFFYPGDAFYNPGKQVDVLALPVAGPWMKLSDALDYLKLIKPKFCIPVHDGMLLPERRGPIDKLAEEVCTAYEGTYIDLKAGEDCELLVTENVLLEDKSESPLRLAEGT